MKRPRTKEEIHEECTALLNRDNSWIDDLMDEVSTMIGEILEQERKEVKAVDTSQPEENRRQENGTVLDRNDN